MSHRIIQYLVYKALVVAGLHDKHYIVHRLRHSLAIHLFDQGTDLHMVKEVLGHSRQTTTMWYIHLIIREDTEYCQFLR